MHRPDVGRMLQEMSMRQFMLWREFDEVEPIGGIRADWQAASICAAIFNTTAMFNRSKMRMSVEQFLLKYGQPRPSARRKEGGSKTPAAAPDGLWQRMKFIAQQQVALSKAEEARKTKKKRG